MASGVLVSDGDGRVVWPVVYLCRVVMEEQCGQWCTCVEW